MKIKIVNRTEKVKDQRRTKTRDIKMNMKGKLKHRMFLCLLKMINKKKKNSINLLRKTELRPRLEIKRYRMKSMMIVTGVQRILRSLEFNAEVQQ